MILPCATKVKKGMYDLEEDLFFGVPTKISSDGVKPIEVNLSNQEKDQLKIFQYKVIVSIIWLQL